jgi:ATP-dependent protease ClpP protease subunit
MLKMLAGLLLVVGLGCLVTVGYISNQKYQVFSSEESPAYIEPLTTAPFNPSASMLMIENKAPSVNDKMEVITLTQENMVVLDQAFTDESVTRVMIELQKLSDNSRKNEVLYLVLNTPGGSVDAGQKLISFAKALPQKVKTLTLFSASMGFQTVQNLDERLILETGTLMSHRARFGVQGQAPGEIYSRLRYIMSMLDVLDATAAARMSMGFNEYRALIHDEYWVFGQQAVKDKAADRTVLAKCGKGLDSTRRTEVDTMFGSFKVKVSACPLMPGILDVEAPSDIKAEELSDALRYVKMMYLDRTGFVREFVMTNKFMEFQK